MTPAFGAVLQTLHDLVDEMKTLTGAAVEGRLDSRSNADKFQGGLSRDRPGSQCHP